MHSAKSVRHSALCTLHFQLPTMVIIGVDYGKKRIGLATGDSGSGFVFPQTAIVRQTGRDQVHAVIDVARTEGASHIVVGIPKRLDGKTAVPGDIEREVRTFVKEFEKMSDLTIDVEDERMSTALAKRLCEAAEQKGEKVDEDSVAACVILESYIMRTFGREDVSWLSE